MSDASVIKLLIVDDHAVIREGIKNIVRDCNDIVVAGEADTGLAAIKLARETVFQVMLLDISLPDRNGLEVLKQIKKEYPQSQILIFSIHREDEYAIRAHKAGASGYLGKECAAQEILHAIRQVAGGLKYISQALAQELANHLTSEHQEAPHQVLSDREYQTMTMIASGKTVTDIAKELSLSVKTVSEYRARILYKMKMRHNAELTYYAIKNQLVD